MDTRMEFAVPAGSDPVSLSRTLREMHDAYLSGERRAETAPGLRPLVRESWERSLRRGVDPESSAAPLTLDDAALEEVRSAHPLAEAMPVIRRLLVDSASDAGLLVAVSDAAGQLLWVEGASDLRSRAEEMLFVAGADWSEDRIGTNAPGTALALDRPVQFLGAEHLARPVTPWSCSAAPIHDPDTGAILGVLDLTGGPEVATAQSLGLVRATVAAVESELRLLRYHRPAPERSPDAAEGPRIRPSGPPRQQFAESSLPIPGGSTGAGSAESPPPIAAPLLSVLGRHAAELRTEQSVTRLSLRHSELLLLLHRDAAYGGSGITAAALALGLSEQELSPISVRAEVSRLRGSVVGVAVESRPYRLLGELRTDAQHVIELLEAQRLREAVAAYRGPVLPESLAPGVVALREELHERLRSHLLASGDADAVLSFADTEAGREDAEMWAHAAEVIPSGSPRRGHVVARAEHLEQQLR